MYTFVMHEQLFIYNIHIGNLVFRQEHLPNECLVYVEALNLLCNIFLIDDCAKKQLFPELKLVKSQLALSLEELGTDVPNFDSQVNILSAVKKSGVKYRFSTSEARKWHTEGLFSKIYNKLYLKVYTFI